MQQTQKLFNHPVQDAPPAHQKSFGLQHLGKLLRMLKKLNRLLLNATQLHTPWKSSTYALKTAVQDQGFGTDMV